LSLRTLSDRLRALEERAGGDGAPPQASTPPASDAAKSTAKRETKRTQTSQAQSSQAQSSQHQTSQASPISTARLTGLWPMVLSAARQRSMQAFGHLQHAAVAEASDDLVTIGVDDKFNRDRLADASMSKLVAEAIAQASGAHPQVRFVLAPPGGGTPKPASGFALAADVLGDDLF
jgi:hypothetical protein